MTLMVWLREYVYIPLGGSRVASWRVYVNILLVFLLSGLWHGAGWTYVIWGGLQGVFIAVHRAWQALTKRLGRDLSQSTWWGRGLGIFVTFQAWLVGLAFFRSENLESALYLLKGLAGMQGVVLPYRWLDKWGAAGQWLAAQGVEFQNLPTFGGSGQINFILVCSIIVWAMPNTQQIMAAWKPALNLPPDTFVSTGRWWAWKPGPAWLLATVVAAAAAILNISELSEFIYFQF